MLLVGTLVLLKSALQCKSIRNLDSLRPVQSRPVQVLQSIQDNITEEELIDYVKLPASAPVPAAAAATPAAEAAAPQPQSNGEGPAAVKP